MPGRRAEPRATDAAGAMGALEGAAAAMAAAMVTEPRTVTLAHASPGIGDNRR